MRYVGRVAVWTLLCLAALGACGPSVPDGVDPAAQAAWEGYQQARDTASFELFIVKNRLAAQAHGHPHDSLGALYQVRALEAQAEQALREYDIALAEEVTLRLVDLEEGEMLVVLEEVLPGATERLLGARARLDEVFK